MRIAITGAAGIGKTTLAKVIGERFGLPIIREDFSEVVRAFNQPESAVSGSARRQACLAWLGRREERQQGLPAFVQDRCAIDILHRWLLFNLSGNDNGETAALIARCRNLLASLDLLVIPPLYLTEETENEDRLVRSPALSLLFRGQAMSIGLAGMLVAHDRLLFIPPAVRNLEARTDLVAARLEKPSGDSRD